MSKKKISALDNPKTLDWLVARFGTPLEIEEYNAGRTIYTIAGINFLKLEDLSFGDLIKELTLSCFKLGIQDRAPSTVRVCFYDKKEQSALTNHCRSTSRKKNDV